MTRAEAVKALDADYARQRLENEREHARRLKNAGSLDPRIPELCDESLSLFRAQARILLTDPEHAEVRAGESKRRALAIHAEIKARLRAAGLPENYLDAVCRCAECGDKGFVGEPVQRRCACFTRRLTEMLYADTGAPDERFETYDERVIPDEPLPGSRLTQRALALRARDFCMAYADAYPNTQKPNLVLLGRSGLGKSFLLHCIAARVIARGGDALSVTAFRAFEAMRACHIGADAEGRRAFEALTEHPFLLIDDLGTEPLMQNVTLEYLFALLNERQSRRLHTVVCTNLAPLDIMNRYNERIYSRLLNRACTDVIELKGRDIRLATGKNGGAS